MAKTEKDIETATSNVSTESGAVIPTPQTVDRVQSLSLRKDGVPDQVKPEIIGDKEAAKEIAKRQFREQAVATVDDQVRRTVEPEAGEQKQDPTIQKLKDAHDKAGKEAESKAESVVESLHKGA